MRRTVSTVIGRYPHTAALRSGAVVPQSVELAFVDVEPVHAAFADMIRHLRYDVCEIAVGAYFQSVEAGTPLTVLPVVTLGGFHHGSIYGAGGRRLAPGDLAGRRVAVRSYSQTTGLWVRGLLEEEYGLAADTITWVTTEGSHVAEYEDPPNVERAAPGATLAGLLRGGEVDAAILGPGKAQPPFCVPLIEDPDVAARRWHERHGFVPVNHLVCAGPRLGADPDSVRDVYQALRGSYARTGARLPPAATCDPERVVPALEYAHGLARRQGLVRGELDVAALFDTVGVAS